MILHYSGIKRDGVSVTARTESLSAATLTESLYRKGFQCARIKDDRGRIVGEVSRLISDGKRVWWGER